MEERGSSSHGDNYHKPVQPGPPDFEKGQSSSYGKRYRSMTMIRAKQASELEKAWSQLRVIGDIQFVAHKDLAGIPTECLVQIYQVQGTRFILPAEQYKDRMFRVDVFFKDLKNYVNEVSLPGHYHFANHHLEDASMPGTPIISLNIFFTHF